jgi:hypothetical protein
MKWQLLVAVSLLVLAPVRASDLAAQQLVPFVGGGLVMGTGDLGQGTNNGWMMLGGVDVPLAAVAPGLGVGVTATYSRIPYGGGFSEATQVTAIAGELSYVVGAAGQLVRPYLRGGGGLHVHRYDPGSIDTNPITDTRAGFTAGAGLNLMVSLVDAMLGARFSSGTDAGFVGFHAGLAFPLF